MGLTFQRHLGKPATMDAGQYCITETETIAGHVRNVFVRCPSCGATNALDPQRHVIAKDGRVTPAYRCADVACPFWEWLTFDSWGLQ